MPQNDLDKFRNQHTLSSQVATPGNMGRRILVVDDEPLVCDSITRILALDQHDVRTAASGQEALAIFQTAKFDVVIIDYQMPDIKGDKLAAAIRALVPQQSIIMITAYGERLRLAGDFPLAVDMVMSKPFAIEELREAVHRLAAKA
jgi:two-component system, cell cycle response regulator CpdR